MVDGLLERDEGVMVAMPGVGVPVVGMPGTTSPSSRPRRSRTTKHVYSTEGRAACLSHDAAIGKPTYLWNPVACATASEARRNMRGFEWAGGRLSSASGRLLLPYQ